MQRLRIVDFSVGSMKWLGYCDKWPIRWNPVKTSARSALCSTITGTIVDGPLLRTGTPRQNLGTPSSYPTANRLNDRHGNNLTPGLRLSFNNPMPRKRKPMDPKKLRTELEMTQQELAVALGVSLSTVANWEAGRVKPSRLALARLDELTRSPRRRS